MKVLHIVTNDNGGAGLAVLRINQALLDAGIDSSILVRLKTSNNPFVFEAEPGGRNVPRRPSTFLGSLIVRFFHHFGLFLTKMERYDHEIERVKNKIGYFDFASPLSSYDLAEHPLVQQADIIHLHWIAGFVDYPSFFGSVRKPIVWTFHDENISFGGFHYTRDKERYYPYVKALEDKFLKIKRTALQGKSNIHVVALSSMMSDFYKRNRPFNDNPISVIHNSVDISSFAPCPKNTAREILHIAQDSIVFSFCSMNISDSRKGLKELISALEKINAENVTLLCAGFGSLPIETQLNVVQVGAVSNPYFLSVFYSCSDYFVMPSYQEAFAQTPLEAMACGVPVIAFPCSGTEDLITGTTGIRCSSFSVESLRQAIEKAMSTHYNGDIIRGHVRDHFSPSTIASQYCGLYSGVSQQ